MAYRVIVKPGAVEDLRRLRAYDQRKVATATTTQLVHEPATATLNRKKLDPNSLAEWELRLGTLRLFYDVDRDEETVWVVAIGEKHGNRLFIRGKEYVIERDPRSSG